MQYDSVSPHRSSLALAIVLLASGCAALPAGSPPAATPVDAAAMASERSLAGSAAAPWPGEDWWRGYGDAQLQALIAEGLAGSPDIAAADARLRRAAGMAESAGAPLLPSLGVDGRATLDKASYNNGFPKAFVPKGWQDNGRIAASLGWDLDLWGRNRAGLAAAVSERRAAEIAAGQARLLLASTIALAYADLARLFEERDIRAQGLALRQVSEKLVAERVAVGVDTRGSLRLAEAQTANAKADLSAAEEALLQRRHQIAALLGKGPDRGLDLARPQWTPAPAVALPGDASTALLARRPDVAMARERLEAAAARIKVARADFFPAIRLSALYGVQSLGLDMLFEKDSTTGSIGPAISLPLFQGGALRGRYRGAQAAYDEAVADYNRTVIEAYRQTADAVTARGMAAGRVRVAGEALAASEEAHQIARLRYKGGLSTYLDVLAVEDRLLQARLAANAVEAAERGADIALIRALGGGYSTAPSSRPEDTDYE